MGRDKRGNHDKTRRPRTPEENLWRQQAAEETKAVRYAARNMTDAEQDAIRRVWIILRRFAADRRLACLKILETFCATGAPGAKAASPALEQWRRAEAAALAQRQRFEQRWRIAIRRLVELTGFGPGRAERVVREVASILQGAGPP